MDLPIFSPASSARISTSSPKPAPSQLQEDQGGKLKGQAWCLGELGEGEGSVDDVPQLVHAAHLDTAAQPLAQ